MNIPRFKIRWKTEKRAKKILKLLSNTWPGLRWASGDGLLDWWARGIPDEFLYVCKSHVAFADDTDGAPTITLRDLKEMAKIKRHGRDGKYAVQVTDEQTATDIAHILNRISPRKFSGDGLLGSYYTWEINRADNFISFPEDFVEITLPALRLMADYLRPQEKEPVYDGDAELNALRERVKELEAQLKDALNEFMRVGQDALKKDSRIAELEAKPATLTFHEFAEAYRRGEAKWTGGATITQDWAMRSIYDELTRQPEPETVPVPEWVRFVGNKNYPRLVIGDTANGMYHCLRWSWGAKPYSVGSSGKHEDKISMVIETNSIKFSELKHGEWFIDESDYPGLGAIELKVNAIVSVGISKGEEVPHPYVYEPDSLVHRVRPA